MLDFWRYQSISIFPPSLALFSVIYQYENPIRHFFDSLLKKIEDNDQTLPTLLLMPRSGNIVRIIFRCEREL